MAIISTLVGTGAGCIYPVYKTYKILMYNPNEASKVLVYWIVYGTFTACQSITDKVLFWVPFYNEIKTGFVIWLTLPATNGYKIIYNKFILKFLKKYEKLIDSGYNTILYLLRNKLIEFSQKLWVFIYEKIFNEAKKNIKRNEVASKTQTIEPTVHIKLIEDTPEVEPNLPIGNSPAYQRKTIVVPSSTQVYQGKTIVVPSSNPVYQGKTIVVPLSSPVIINNKRLEYRSPSTIKKKNNIMNNINNNINDNSNSPVIRNIKKTTPLPYSDINDNHISDKYQKIRAYKEQLLDVITQLEKDEEKELNKYNKNNTKSSHNRSKSNQNNNNNTITKTNLNNNIIINNNYNKSNKNNNKEDDFEYIDSNFDEKDYETILTNSKAFIKSNRSRSITNFFKNLKSR